MRAFFLRKKMRRFMRCWMVVEWRPLSIFIIVSLSLAAATTPMMFVVMVIMIMMLGYVRG
jgi:hypothetical protein